MSSWPLQRACHNRSPHLQEKPFPIPAGSDRGSFIQSRSGPFWGRSVWALFLAGCLVGDGGPLSSLAHCWPAWTRALLQRTAASSTAHASLDTAAVLWRGSQFPLHRPGLAWLPCVQGCCGLQAPARRGWIPPCAAAGRQRLWRGWGSPQVMAETQGAPALEEPTTLSLGLSPLSLCPFLPFPESLRLGPLQSLFTAGVRSTPQCHQLRSTKF